jgi:hypothetical protein
MASVQTLPPKVVDSQRIALIVGAVGVVLCVVGWISGGRIADAFYRSWLFAWFYFFGATVGCMAWVMIHHLVGGGWGRAIQRLAEAGAANILVMAVLFIPIVIAGKHLYPWADPSRVATDAVLTHRVGYLNLGFWLGRSIFYIAAFAIMIYSLIGLQHKFDRNHSSAVALLCRRISAGGLVFYVFGMTFAAVDWIMSREPTWYSNVYGFIIVVGQSLTAINILVVLLTLLVCIEPLKSFVTRGHYNDLGNLMLTTTILWAYMNLAQFLISWMGGIQVDVRYYSTRWNLIYAVSTIVLHFFIPFFFLLVKDFKRSPDKLWMIAAFLLLVHLFDVYWMVWPSNPPSGPPSFSRFWLNIAAPVGIGGIWIGLLLSRLGRKSLLAELAHKQPSPSLESLDDPEVGPHGEHHAHPA